MYFNITAGTQYAAKSFHVFFQAGRKLGMWYRRRSRILTGTILGFTETAVFLLPIFQFLNNKSEHSLIFLLCYK